MSVVTGWSSIVLALLAVVVSFGPGATSVIGLAMSLMALLSSLFSIKVNGKKYFRLTVFLVIAGALLVNDALRIWEPLPMPFDFRLCAYAILFLVTMFCFIAAHRLARSTHGTSSKTNIF